MVDLKYEISTSSLHALGRCRFVQYKDHTRIICMSIFVNFMTFMPFILINRCHLEEYPSNLYSYLIATSIGILLLMFELFKKSRQ